MHKIKIKTGLERALHFNFSHVFNGIVWNSVVSEDGTVLVFEIRDSERKQVSFAALNVSDNSWLWQHVVLDEKWWVNLNSVSSGLVLFTVYTETNNPDKKGVLAYDLPTCSLQWWSNDFSVVSVSKQHVVGTSSKYGLREVTLNLQTGKEVKDGEVESVTLPEVIKPQHYSEGTDYFNTVKTFLEQKLNLVAVHSLEYLEHKELIFISFYRQHEGLANDLIVLSATGKVVLHEKMSEQQKGIGFDTFFILAGCVFFVKNKTELVRYTIV